MKRSHQTTSRQLGICFAFAMVAACGSSTPGPLLAGGSHAGGTAGQTAGVGGSDVGGSNGGAGRAGSGGNAGSGGANGGGGAAGSGGIASGGTGGGAGTGGAGGGAGGSAGVAGTSGGTGGRGGDAGASGGTGGTRATGGTGGATGGSTGGTGGAMGVSESIHYYGRWNRLADRAIAVNTGSHVVAQFTGTAISAKFDISLNKTPNPTLAWRIDQGTWQEGEIAATLPLGSGLTAGTHDVTLMVRGLDETQSRWTPPLVSSITFLGFDVTGGEVQSTTRPVRPKIEFLGDSITEGINVFSGHNGKNTGPWNADGRRAYASQTAQSLSAEWRQVGFGRQGLLIGGNGGVPVANDAFNWIYKGVARDDWQPDLVVINQGTNDGGAAASSFQPAYATFLTTIRAAYPAAKIVALRPFNGAHAAEIRALIDARKSAGDSRVYFVDTTGWLGTGDFTDGVHPNEQGSQKAAMALVTAIKSVGLP